MAEKKESNKLKNKSFLGLLGENTKKSLSPFIHNHSAEWLGLNSSYEAYSLQREELASFLETFTSQGGLGLNVTNPHKSRVVELLGEVKLSSVNTLKREGNSWKAYSTDGEGFWKALRRHDQEVSYEAFCFLGSGDVFLSILDFIKDKIAGKTIYFIRRGKKNDEKLKALYKNIEFLPFEPQSLKFVVEKMESRPLCLVQGTSAPSKGEDLSQFIEALQNFQGSFQDLVYGKPSALYVHLKERGFLSLDGLPMLIEQALLAQRIWWGKSASYEEVYAKLKESGFA